MNRSGRWMVWASLALGPVSILPAAEPASPAPEPLLGLFDTVRPPAGNVPGADVQAKPGWQRVAEDQRHFTWPSIGFTLA